MTETKIVDCFPYEKIMRPDGDMFSSWQEAKDAGYADTQIWSVIHSDDESDSWFYGPPFHYVNHLGHIATKEHHNNDEYYEELA